ncbi:MAG: pantoate--beta-alanine ligase [Bryobacteraceae bacterium]
MRVWHQVSDWLAHRKTLTGKSVGVVPTMGALHRGHAALVERCRRENDVAVVTLFVNPSQFNDPKDLEKYPRTLEADLDLLRSLGVDDVIVPDTKQLYPHGYRIKLDPVGHTPVMEHLHRPGFLQGVLTVVLKLLSIAQADRAYFGEKDYQQLRAVTEMVEEFFLPTQIVPCETVREESGLALSSRNALLSAEGRVKANAIYRALTTAPNVDAARAALEAEGFRVDYVEEHWGRRFAAAFLEGIRLIDNVAIIGR